MVWDICNTITTNGFRYYPRRCCCHHPVKTVMLLPSSYTLPKDINCNCYCRPPPVQTIMLLPSLSSPNNIVIAVLVESQYYCCYRNDNVIAILIKSLTNQYFLRSRRSCYCHPPPVETIIFSAILV